MFNTYEGLTEVEIPQLHFVWDFFTTEIVRLALQETWNDLCNPDEVITAEEGFSIFNLDHLRFLRPLFETNEFYSLFLQKVRKNSLSMISTKSFTHTQKEITAFILLCEELRHITKFSTDDLWLLMRERVWTIITPAGMRTAITQNWIQRNKVSSISAMPTNGFSPVNDKWEVCYCIKDNSEYWFMMVVSIKSGQHYINRKWEILTEEAKEAYKNNWIKRKIRHLKRCLDYVNWDRRGTEKIKKIILNLKIQETEDKKAGQSALIQRLQQEIEKLKNELPIPRPDYLKLVTTPPK